MPEELNDVAKEIAELRRTVRILADDADRMLLTRIIEDADVRRLLERVAGVVL